jgi:prepilin-type N-terminal cleavage/methylation domain-containing protein
MSQENPMNRRKAFTLVELLVVIGIIAILVGILLPALGKARNQARLVQCASNMRMIGQAMMNYAADNHNFLPEHAYNDAPWQEAGGMTDVMQRGIYDYAFLMQGGDPNTEGSHANLDTGANMGRLIMTGYLGNYTITQANLANPNFCTLRWCPALDPSSLPAGTSSYYMNPHWSYTTASNIPVNGSTTTTISNPSPHVSVHTTWFRKITDYPKTLAMLTETYFNPTLSYSGASSISHPGPGKSAYWNILLPDGHVATVSDTLAVQYFNLGGTSYQINSGTDVGEGQPLTDFDDALDIWETEADGRNPNYKGKFSSMALPGYATGDTVHPYYLRCLHYPSETGGANYTGPTNWGY